MQTLIFNTSTKKVKLLSGSQGESQVLETFDNVSTVKCSELGFYEVMLTAEAQSVTSIPVMRLPFSNTNMLIEK